MLKFECDIVIERKRECRDLERVTAVVAGVRWAAILWCFTAELLGFLHMTVILQRRVPKRETIQ